MKDEHRHNIGEMTNKLVEYISATSDNETEYTEALLLTAAECVLRSLAQRRSGFAKFTTEELDARMTYIKLVILQEDMINGN